MPQNDDWRTKRFGRSKDEAPPEVPPQATVELEAADPRVGAKTQTSVTFIDAEGQPFQFAYNHHYRTYVDGRSLVVQFSDHRVVIDGTGLFSPAMDCLMRRLGQHKVEFVEASPRGELDGAEVTSIRVEEIKAG